MARQNIPINKGCRAPRKQLETKAISKSANIVTDLKKAELKTKRKVDESQEEDEEEQVAKTATSTAKK